MQLNRANANALPAPPADTSGRYTDNGHNDLSLRNTTGCSTIFQYSRNPNIAAESIPFFAIGTAMWTNIINFPAPSSLAASTTDAGTRSKALNMINIGNVENTSGNIIAQWVLTICIPLSTIY